MSVKSYIRNYILNINSTAQLYHYKYKLHLCTKNVTATIVLKNNNLIEML